MINPERNEMEKDGPINTFVVIAIHGKYIKRCLNSLNKTVDREKHKIILVEGPSAEERPILYEHAKDKVDLYIRTETNYGFSKSVNIGLRQTDTPYFTVVHDDVTFLQPGWWEACEKQLREDDDLIMIQPSQRNRREKGDVNHKYDMFYPVSKKEYEQLVSEAKAGSIAEIWCMVFKREWLDLVGYFDERIFPVGPEDLEIYRQAQWIGKRTAVSGDAVVYHKGVGRQDASGGGRDDRSNEMRFNDKWGGKDGVSIGGLSHGDPVKPKYLNLIKHL